MSREDDDARQYRCFKKCEEIVKQVLQLDELADSVDPRSRLPKRKRNSRVGSTAANGSMPDQESFDQVVVQTITKFLHDLNAITIDPDPKPSSQ